MAQEQLDFGLTKKRKTHKEGDVQKLAKFFVTDILGQEFSYELSRRYLREAKLVLRPAEGKGTPLAYDVVIGTLLALKRGQFDLEGEVTSIWAVTWGTPPYHQQYTEYMASPPPAWNRAEVRMWEKITERIAYPETGDIMVGVPSLPKITLDESFLE